jgi:glucose dehydrogenase
MRKKAITKGGLPELRSRQIGVGIALAALLCLGSPAQAADPEEDGQWVMPGKNYAGLRFSGLDQINVGNANNLQVAWTFSVGVLRGQEAAPIVADSTMFVVTPYPNIL